MSSEQTYEEPLGDWSNDNARNTFLSNVCEKVKEKFPEFLRKLGVQEHIVHEYLEQGERSHLNKLTVLLSATKGISFEQLRPLVGGVKKELHHGRSTEVDELINKMEKPLVAEARHEAWFLYDFVHHNFNDLPTVALTHFGIEDFRHQYIMQNYKDKSDQRYRLMIEWKDKSDLNSLADMLEKLEELRLSMPETCRCAVTKTPPVSSGNQAVGAGAPSNATLPSSDPVTLSDNPNSSRFGPPLRAVPRYHAEGPRTSSHVHSGSEPFCTDDTSVDGNSSTEEAPNISREIKSAVSDAISNQPDAAEDSTKERKAFQTKSQSPIPHKLPPRSSRKCMDTTSTK